VTYVLAINPTIEGFGTHDPAAALFADDGLAFAIEEGRLIDRKRAPETFPTAAVGSCLDYAGIDGSAIDRVVIPWNVPIGAENGSVAAKRRRAGLERAIVEAVGRAPPVDSVNHHRSHAASAFVPSGFDEALVLTIDGRGGRDSTVVWRGGDGTLKRIRRYEAPNSLGYLYAAVAGYLGFQPFGGEGKMMGLAPYGAIGSDIGERFRGAVRGGVDYDVTPLVGSGVPTAIDRLERLFGAPRASSRRSVSAREKALARTVQAFLEETVVAICETYCAELGLDRVCLAGGVALNCKLNQRLAESPAVSELFVQPVAHDAGAALGAALVTMGTRSLPATVYLGPSAEPNVIKRLLVRDGVEYSVPDDPVEYAAVALAEGAIVGWFQGRLEMGPRALGNRSILADPRSSDARGRVNGFVKGRASWRPFAPSVLAESATRYFNGPMPAPHMMRTVDVTPQRDGEIPAARHPGDGTARPQTVTRGDNPRYHRLLEAFAERTGVPVLLNTSFNESGAPIVATPADALDVFDRTGLDLLVLEDCVVERSDHRQ
jgi:carbamoyltransferase